MGCTDKMPTLFNALCLPCFLLQREEERKRRSGGRTVLSSATGGHADRVSTAPYLGATLYSLKRKFMGQNNSSLNIGLLLLPWLGRICSTLGNMDSSKLSLPNLRYLKVQRLAEVQEAGTFFRAYEAGCMLLHNRAGPKHTRALKSGQEGSSVPKPGPKPCL